MPRIVVRIRPLEIMEDLKPELIVQRAALVDSKMEFFDNRLSDASFVSLVMTIPSANLNSLERLKTVFSDLPRMRVLLWHSYVETPLAELDLKTFRDATLGG